MNTKITIRSSFVGDSIEEEKLKPGYKSSPHAECTFPGMKKKTNDYDDHAKMIPGSAGKVLVQVE